MRTRTSEKRHMASNRSRSFVARSENEGQDPEETTQSSGSDHLVSRRCTSGLSRAGTTASVRLGPSWSFIIVRRRGSNNLPIPRASGRVRDNTRPHRGQPDDPSVRPRHRSSIVITDIGLTPNRIRKRRRYRRQRNRGCNRIDVVVQHLLQIGRRRGVSGTVR